jgi:hypothetical protein
MRARAGEGLMNGRLKTDSNMKRKGFLFAALSFLLFPVSLTDVVCL